MDCRVISISRTIGAGAVEIGRAVSGDLGFRYVDREIIDWAAEKAGVSPETMERIERAPSLVERILQHVGSAPLESGGYVPPLIAPSRGYEDLIRQVIHDTAKAGNVVIVAHGASIPLAGTTGLLRVLLTASPSTRAERIARQSGIDSRRAKKAIADSDRERADYLQRLYGVQHELPTNYDLVLNTDSLTPAKAVRLIVSAAQDSE